MGWQTQDGLVIGDEPIDLLGDCLKRIAECYQEDVGRHPTTDELLESIRQVLNTYGRMLESDLAEREVTRLSMRSKRLPKTQKFGPGDLFAIPLKSEYRYGRILKDTAAGDLIEIYDLRSEQLLTGAQVLARKPKAVWQKHVHGIGAFRNRRWPIIGHKAVEADYDYAPFYFGASFIGFTIERGRKSRRQKKVAIGEAEPMICFDPETIENRVSSDTPDPWPEVVESMRRDARE